MSSSFVGTSGLSRIGGVGARSRIAWKISADVSPRKGNVPVAISYSTAPKRKQICPCIEFLSLCLFRRHIGDSAERRSWAGQVLFVYGACLGINRSDVAR